MQRTFLRKIFTKKLLITTLTFTLLTFFVSFGVCSLIDYWIIGNYWVIGSNWNIPVGNNIPTRFSPFFSLLGLLFVFCIFYGMYQLITSKKIAPLEKVLSIVICTFIIAYIFSYAIVALFA